MLPPLKAYAGLADAIASGLAIARKGSDQPPDDDPDGPEDLKVDEVFTWIERNRDILSFKALKTFLDGPANRDSQPAYGLDSYRQLKELVLTYIRWWAAGPSMTVDPKEAARRKVLDDMLSRLQVWHQGDEYPIIPYFETLSDRLAKEGLVAPRVLNPLPIDLIWSYWMEQGLLVQTLNAICVRFQNRRSRPGPGPDPLFRFDVSPLTELSNLLWSFIEAEPHRTSVVRRAYEYDHEYGLTLHGRAIRRMDPSDPRSTFMAAFHGLLQRCMQFYAQDDDRMVWADGFPVLNALRETHLILGEGNHNQSGELLVVSRAEMLIEQWILGHDEIGKFLGGRVMTPYPEVWMDRVDTLKGLFGISGPSIIQFHDLATAGEWLVLAIRNGAWSTCTSRSAAKKFARKYRRYVQKYVHAYRAVTGVDLSSVVSEALSPQVVRRQLARTPVG